MKTNKILFSMLAISVCFVSVGCGNKKNSHSSSNKPIDIEHYYETVEDRALYDNENPNNFVQTFDNGLDDNLFYALEGAWHNTTLGAEHGGMKHRNLFYAQDDEDTYLAIKARGYFSKEDPTTIGLPEGGCIITKNHLGPGRYEIEMAAMPREGGVSTMWTYCTLTGSEETSQNEIDIEIGGTTNGTNFENIWYTTWTKKTVKDTDTVDVTNDLYLNDGRIHKYTFDWYTDYNSQGIKRVDWFIDGKFYKSLEGNVVPEHEMPLWIGVWFPPLWAGNAAFEEDYLLIKSISYKAFDPISQFYETCRTQPGYSKVAPSSLNIQTIDLATVRNVNKLSNGGMESLDVSSRNGSYFGWSVHSASKGSIELTQGNQSEHGFLLKAATDSSDRYHGEYLVQTLTNAFHGYHYNFSIDAKKMTADTDAAIEIQYLDASGRYFDKMVIPVDSLEYKTYTQSLICPENTTKIEITLAVEDGSASYDNASLIYVL